MVQDFLNADDGVSLSSSLERLKLEVLDSSPE